MKDAFNHVMAQSEKLLTQAQAQLERRLAARPEDAALRRRFAEVLRQRGLLAEAAAQFRRVAEAGTGDKEDEAAYLAALLGGERCTGPFNGGEGTPLPFVYLTDVLTGKERERLWKLALSQREAFEASAVVGGVVDTDYRNSHGLHRFNLLAPVRAWYLPRLKALLEGRFDHLGEAPFEPSKAEMHLLSYRDGEFFKAHDDNRRSVTRRLTAVYYFFRDPKQFSGGDLLLYDTDLENRLPLARFTRLVPENNSLVLFPSSYFHQVTPIHGPREIEDGRFALVTWLHGQY